MFNIKSNKKSIIIIVVVILVVFFFVNLLYAASKVSLYLDSLNEYYDMEIQPANERQKAIKEVELGEIMHKIDNYNYCNTEDDCVLYQGCFGSLGVNKDKIEEIKKMDAEYIGDSMYGCTLVSGVKYWLLSEAKKQWVKANYLKCKSNKCVRCRDYWCLVF